jgi:hypothetical protein
MIPKIALTMRKKTGMVRDPACQSGVIVCTVLEEGIMAAYVKLERLEPKGATVFVNPAIVVKIEDPPEPQNGGAMLTLSVGDGGFMVLMVDEKAGQAVNKLGQKSYVLLKRLEPKGAIVFVNPVFVMTIEAPPDQSDRAMLTLSAGDGGCTVLMVDEGVQQAVNKLTSGWTLAQHIRNGR